MESKVYEGEILAGRHDDARLYDGVLSKRMLAFVIDYVLIFLLLIPVAIVVALLGVLTLGLGWMLFGVLGPLTALAYVAMTLGGRRQATKGMQMMGIRLERLDGRPVDGLLAMVHTVLFWAGNAILTPLILLATLFTDRKRTLNDLLLVTVVVRSAAY